MYDCPVLAVLDGCPAVGPCDLLNVPPALQQRPTDTVHASIDAMVRMADVVHHLIRRTPVTRRERLVPGGEDVFIRLGRSVLREATPMLGPPRR